MKQPTENPDGQKNDALEELEQLETAWSTWGIADESHDSVGETIKNEPTEELPPAVMLGMQRLGAVEDESLPEFELREALGSGGTSVVHVGFQRSLGRDVAIKVLREDCRSEASREALIREARVIGSLEHPNIIPVHTIGLDPDGEPHLVMKRIEGTSWRELLAEGADPRENRQTGDSRLESNIDILMQVAKAVHFAHTRGVVHRDLKPENVMLDSFGDVYLLDWGLAMAVEQTGGHSGGIAGTPCYMAPEMVEPERGVITSQTDVYLLGAILHELIIGKPPHEAETVYQSMTAAFLSRPGRYPRRTPEELVGICRKAMAREPADRFASAEDFRQAVAGYLRHRESYAVAHEATSQLESLRSFLTQKERPATVVYRQFGAVRFGFEQALRIWRTNKTAREGLVETLRQMAQYELDHGHANAAEVLRDDLIELEHTDQTLNDRITEVRVQNEKKDQELVDLRELEHQLDSGIGARTRSLLTLTLGFLFLASSLAIGFLVRAYRPDGVEPAVYLTHAFLWIVSLSALLFLGRKTILRNRANRQIGGMALALFCGGAFFRVLSALLDVDFLRVFPLEYSVYVTGLTVFAVSQDRRLLWSVVPMAVAAFVMIAWPMWTFEISGAGLVICALTIAYYWGPRRKREDQENSS